MPPSWMFWKMRAIVTYGAMTSVCDWMFIIIYNITWNDWLQASNACLFESEVGVSGWTVLWPQFYAICNYQIMWSLKTDLCILFRNFPSHNLQLFTVYCLFYFLLSPICTALWFLYVENSLEINFIYLQTVYNFFVIVADINNLQTEDNISKLHHWNVWWSKTCLQIY